MRYGFWHTLAIRQAAVAVTSLALVLGLAAAPAILARDGQLPDGPGRAELQKVCGTCHEPIRAASVRLTEEGWQGVVADMKTRGAQGTDAEFDAVLKYLVTNFLGEGLKPLNVNLAPTIDLESVAGLTRKEAAAVRAALDKSPCQKLEDLKKIQGLDYNKIEERKDFLVCF